MTLEVHLKDIVTGTTGVYVDNFFPDALSLDDLTFLWGEGNFACDCNRSRFLYGEAGPHLECGSDRITVTKAVIVETGQVLCTDDIWLAPAKEADDARDARV